MTGADPTLFELFREEARAHAAMLGTGVLDLESEPTNPRRLEPLMRAAHSIKGAARIVNIEPAVRLAHAMEDVFVAAQNGTIRITPNDTDLLLRATDILATLATLEPGTVADWIAANTGHVDALEPDLQALVGRQPAAPIVPPAPAAPRVQAAQAPVAPAETLPPIPEYRTTSIPAEPFLLGDDHTMFDLFREEVRAGLQPLGNWLVTATAPVPEPVFDGLHAIRGSARLMKCAPVEQAVATMGEFLDAAGKGRLRITAEGLDWLRYAVSRIAEITTTDADTFSEWLGTTTAALEQIAITLSRAVAAAAPAAPVAAVAAPAAPVAAAASTPAPQPARMPEPTPLTPAAAHPSTPAEAVVRVTAQSLNRLMGLAGESLVQARWLNLFSTSLLKMKKQHELLAGMLDGAFTLAAACRPPDQIAQAVAETRRQAATCRQELTDQATDFDDHAARAEDLNSRLYREVIASRMRPFGDGVQGFARMVRDAARTLGKQARLVLDGESTDVDRDILERLEAPLTHLIRNAVDHGLESPEERAGKPEVGTIRLDARHRAGMLSVTVSDDGRGIDLDKIRRKVVERGLSPLELTRQMTDAEVLEFLFLPGFSTANEVSEISGRGVGLDVVQDMARRVGGNVRITTKLGQGTTFHLQLPITLSVIRAVVVEVGGEPYAFPHTRIDRLLRLPRSSVKSLEHRQFVVVDGHNVGLVLAGQILDVPADPIKGSDMPVVLLSDAAGMYGLVVDNFRGEQDLVVRPLDPRLGKVPNLSAAAVLEDGEPVLIVDVEDLIRSMDQFIQTGSLRRCEVRELGPGRKKRVLVADDSITVREVERQLLLHKGYEVTVAVDGMDAWNQVRGGRYDLLVTDVDMPRMNGIQLVQAVRADEKLRELPVIIVSYKEREEDRLRGLEVGANYYLTKSSFHDNRFVEAVMALIGAA